MLDRLNVEGCYHRLGITCVMDNNDVSQSLFLSESFHNEQVGKAGFDSPTGVSNDECL